MKIFLPALLCFLSFSVLAQKSKKEKDGYKIIGRLTDSVSKHPLEYATISIFPEGAKKPVNGAVSDNNGNFIVNSITAGTYKLVAEFIGYKPHTLYNISVNKEHPLIDIKDISLEPKATAMQAITISGQPKIMENKIDKLVFNAERDLTSQVGVATDILKKIPQVSVDVDGNVELAGSSSIRFLINGKPSAAFGSDITEVLQAIPASQIKSIEVITTPGAKYDAQGLGGIINIILKKNNSHGVNGNVSLTGGTRTENGSFNFNARKGKFGMNAYVSGNTRLKAQSLSSSDRLTNDTSANTTVLLHQASSGNDQRSGYETGLGFDYDINDHNGISGSLSFRNFGHKSSALNNQVQETKDMSGNILSDIENSINSDHTFHFHNLDASLDYKKTFAKDDQELDLSVNTSSGNRSVIDNNYQYLLPQDSLVYSTRGKNPGTEKETEIRLDYTQPLKKNVILGVGGKLSFYDIAGNSDVLKLNGPEEYIKDNYLSNVLDYHQKVYALYAEMTFPVFNWFNAKIGERYERTEINSYFSDALQQAKIPGYNTFV
ncbi:MAG: TonB-dependent receptor, partial [Ginsengibacter sp.]